MMGKGATQEIGNPLVVQNRAATQGLWQPRPPVLILKPHIAVSPCVSVAPPDPEWNLLRVFQKDCHGPRLATHRSRLLRQSVRIHELGEARFEGITRMGQVVFTR